MPAHPKLHATAIELGHDLVVQFRVEAAKRELAVLQLVHDLLVVIATDGLTRSSTTAPS